MKIKQAINYPEMEMYLNAPIESFQPIGEVTHTKDGIYIYKNQGASILAVAHLDSVNEHNHFYVNKFGDDDILFSTHLDDRLGAYIILVVLPRMGIHTDILLTEGEEKGKSTAAYFKSDKQYKWMFSFDRKGTDAVHYRYTATQWLAALKQSFGPVSRGSNSDIDYLSHLKCCGVNVGTGYHDEHHIMAYANMSETASMIGKFMQFYHSNKSIEYPHANWVANPAPTYQPWSAPVSAIPVSEEKEDEEYEIFNPYEDVEPELPLDVEEYIDEHGIIQQPEKCGFCLKPLTIHNTHAFMGICTQCEPWAIQCYYCKEYVCRSDAPEEDMGEELYYGICTICEQYDRRFIGNDNTDKRFSEPGDGPQHCSPADETDAGDTGELPFGIG